MHQYVPLKSLYETFAMFLLVHQTLFLWLFVFIYWKWEVKIENLWASIHIFVTFFCLNEKTIHLRTRINIIRQRDTFSYYLNSWKYFNGYPLIVTFLLLVILSWEHLIKLHTGPLHATKQIYTCRTRTITPISKFVAAIKTSSNYIKM